MDKGTVIITGADTATGLTTARALRDLDVEVIGLFEEPGAVALQSRYWSRTIRVAGNASDQLRMLRDLASQGEFSAKSVLLFSQDSHVIAASEELDQLRAHFVVPMPAPLDCNVMMDKTLFHAWALDNEVDVPCSEIVQSLDQVWATSGSFRFPCILKPLVRTQRWDSVNRTRKFYFIEDHEHLDELLKTEDPFQLSPRYVLQEWIPGGDSDVFFVLFSIDNNGSILSEFVGQKVWQWPPLGGSTAVCQSVQNEELLSLGRDIATRLRMVGLGSVEFKRDPRSGRFVVTEPTVGRNDYQSGVALADENNPTKALVCNCLSQVVPQSRLVRRYRPTVWIDELSAYRYAKARGSVFRLFHIFRLVLSIRRIRFLFFDFRDMRPFWLHLRKNVRRKRVNDPSEKVN